MSKTSYKTQECLEAISTHAFNIAKELEGYLEEDYIDEQLILDIASAFSSWRSRVSQIKDPYCVWFWDGNLWSKVTNDMYQEDAYKHWYKLTSGGKVNSSPKFEKYYFLGESNIQLIQKHEQQESDDDSVSIRYLLSKSFGE